MTSRWATTAEAAELLGVGTSQIAWLLRRSDLVGERQGRRWLVDLVSVERLAAARAEQASTWVSYDEAGVLAGVSHHTVWKAVRAGQLVSRDQRGIQLPSLRRSDVEAWAEGRRRSATAAARRRARRVAAETVRRAALLPPDDGQVWLDVGTAALVLGMTPNGVRYRVGRDLLPHVRWGSRVWLRRDHVEQAAAARVLLRAAADSRQEIRETRDVREPARPSRRGRGRGRRRGTPAG